MESNNSYEIQDTERTSNIPGFPNGQRPKKKKMEKKKKKRGGGEGKSHTIIYKKNKNTNKQTRKKERKKETNI